MGQQEDPLPPNSNPCYAEDREDLLLDDEPVKHVRVSVNTQELRLF